MDFEGSVTVGELVLAPESAGTREFWKSELLFQRCGKLGNTSLLAQRGAEIRELQGHSASI